MTRTSISVVVSAYNPVYLDETLRSIAGQDIPGLDIVVVDDGSDPRVTVPAQLGVPVHIVRNEVSSERAQARNAGLHAAQGDWVMVVDHDDLVAEGALRQMLDAALTTGSDAVFARTSRAGTEVRAPFVPTGDSRSRRHTRAPKRLRWWDVFCSSDDFGMVLAKTGIARDIGFSPEFVPADDYLYAIEVAAAAHAVRVECIAGAWRQHPQQSTQTAEEAIMDAADRVRHKVISSRAPRGSSVERCRPTPHCIPMPTGRGRPATARRSGARSCGPQSVGLRCWSRRWAGALWEPR